MKAGIKLIYIVIGLFLMYSIPVQGGDLKDYFPMKTKPSTLPGRVVLDSIENRYGETVLLYFEDEYEGRMSEPQILKKGETKKWDFVFNVIWVSAITPSPRMELYRSSTPDVVDDKLALSVERVEKHDSDDKVVPQKDSPKKPKKDNKRKSKTAKKAVPAKKVIADFYVFVDSIPVLSEVKFDIDSVFIGKHIENLHLHSINAPAYIKEQNLRSYIAEQNDTIRQLRSQDSMLVANFLQRYENVETLDSCIVWLSAILSERIGHRESLIEPLSDVVGKTSVGEIHIDWKTAGVCIAVVLLIVLLLLWYRKANKNHNQRMQHKKVTVSDTRDADDEPSLVVVTHKTSSTLKKQSLDDVVENEAYCRIDAKEFCTDSSIRTMYIKNTCVRDIYNMYAEDLRNPDNPKEDGCMVLGRWVLDESTQLYDVSLEYIVRPGDDAVFEKYELNFGGKIKLKVSDRLRRLRRETNLQYDLTCWVHSHPGLGVFFSNSDSNVHMQLKHPVHPKFLTALVIDILTPQQEMGIFTFKQDETINSKNDIMKMYSLEELYQWALASERKTLDTDDYYDVLGQARDHLNECYCIQLSNSSIIDMTFLAAKPNGFIGFVHGFTMERGERMRYVISSVTKNETAPDNEMLGCFVVASHCSIPSIRKMVSRYISDIRFVFVYTVTDGMLTSIPVINQELCVSDIYYGEQKLEDLKIWTRRRR